MEDGPFIGVDEELLEWLRAKTARRLTGTGQPHGSASNALYFIY